MFVAIVQKILKNTLKSVILRIKRVGKKSSEVFWF